jgi:Ca2+-binding EF-hand superfamily protein
MNIKKNLSIIVFSLILVSVFAPIVKAETVANLKAQIVSIQNQITQIKSQLDAITRALTSIANGLSNLTGTTSTPTPLFPPTPSTPILPPTPIIIIPPYKCPDINNDSVVDMKDTAITARAVDTCSGNASYNALGDVNGDNCITITDVNYVAKFFGKSASTIAQCKTATQIQDEITTITNTITQMVEQVKVTTPPPNESGYKCPDINSDSVVDMKDTAITARAVDTCSGNASYNALGDVNWDNCINITDVNYVAKFFGKAISAITQCTTIPPLPPTSCPDINSDGKIDMRDTAISAKAANTCSGSALYNALADVNKDNCITEIDINYIASFFGQNASAIGPCQ